MNEHNFNLKWFDFSINGKDARKKEIVTHLENGFNNAQSVTDTANKIKSFKKITAKFNSLNRWAD